MVQLVDAPYCFEFLTWTWNSLLIYDLILCLPTGFFLVFLLLKLPSALRKLLDSESLIMSTYYGFIWSVCVFNIGRCLLNYLFPQQSKYGPQVYQGLWLLSSSILIFVEVSVVVFMSHGYVVSGREAIHRTIWITGIISVIYSTIQGILLFGLGVPLYSIINTQAALYWFITSLVFMVVYGIILILPHTSLKDRFPARPSFYRYVSFLFTLNALKGLGYLLVLGVVDTGFCFVALSQFAYFSLYAPLLYICFLKDFFKDIPISDYLVEMRKSGYYDTDT